MTQITLNQVAIFERTLTVLRTIHDTPVATTEDIKKVLGVSLRTAQRCASQLEAAGYIKCKLGAYKDSRRLFLTEKAKRLMGAVA